MTTRGEGLSWVEALIAENPETCRLWPFGISHGGYGIVRYQGKDWTVPALILTLTVGSRPAKHIACHAPVICHERSCCTPSHLRWGTYAENQADRVADKTHNRGERQWKARLTSDLVLQMRAAVSGGRSVYALAKENNLPYATVSEAVRGKTWKHI